MVHEIDLSRTDLNLLVLFETVLRERHVGRAAERLNLSPSAVSHGLGRLRAQLNDPLFLKVPRGVVPTERAKALAEPIADILARVRSVVASAEPFDPATSHRRFVVGSPDGSAIVALPRLLAHLAEHAPGIDIGSRQIMPDVSLARPWDTVYRALDAGLVHIAAITFGEVPSRFTSRPLFDDRFVVVCRRDHPFVADPSIDAYCAARHMVVSTSGDPGTFTGDVLAGMGRARRVQATVPNFVAALLTAAESDLLATVPISVFEHYGRHFDLVGTPPPFDQGEPSHVRLVAPKSAMGDAGIVWLMDLIEKLERR